MGINISGGTFPCDVKHSPLPLRMRPACPIWLVKCTDQWQTLKVSFFQSQWKMICPQCAQVLTRTTNVFLRCSESGHNSVLTDPSIRQKYSWRWRTLLRQESHKTSQINLSRQKYSWRWRTLLLQESHKTSQINLSLLLLQEVWKCLLIFSGLLTGWRCIELREPQV